MRNSTRYVTPVGSSWQERKIDEEAISRYRFDESPFARLKTRIDIAAAIYLSLVIVAFILDKTPVPRSGIEALTLISDSYTLRPLLSHTLPQSIQIVWADLIIFALLLGFTFLHQSRWLKLRIHYEYLTSPRCYQTVFGPKSTLTRGQRIWTIGSTLINRVVALGLLAIAMRYLWTLRLLPITHDALILGSLVFGGMLLAVVGATSIIGALDTENASVVSVCGRAFIGALVCGGTFGAILAIGLDQGRQGGAVGFAFGFGLALSGLVCRDLIARPRRARLSEQLENVLLPIIRPQLITLGRLIDVPLAWTLSVLSPRRKVKPLPIAENWTSYEIVGKAEGISYGYLRKPKPRVPPRTTADNVRTSLLHDLLKENSWLTRWLRREPVRAIGSHRWEEEDPLDYQHRVRRVAGYSPDFERVDVLYRRLLALMIGTFLVASVVKLIIGYIVAVVGRPLLEFVPWDALTFGLVVGVLFASVGVLGRSSFGALTIGLLSGLSLDPALGLMNGLWFRLSRVGLLVVVTVLLTFIINKLDRQVLWIGGVLALVAGIYLQSLPYLIPK